VHLKNSIKSHFLGFVYSLILNIKYNKAFYLNRDLNFIFKFSVHLR